MQIIPFLAIDILTPGEFNRGLEIMAQTLEPIESVSEEMLDKLAALGMISVFDVEEVGADVLVNELEINQETANLMVASAADRAKQVAEDQQREKEEAMRRRTEEEEAARRLLAGDGTEGDVSPDVAAAAILSAGTSPPPATATSDSTSDDAQARADAILSGHDIVTEQELREEKAEDQVDPAHAHDADPGYDPGEAADAPSPSDADAVEGQEIVDNAVHQILKDGDSAPKEQ